MRILVIGCGVIGFPVAAALRRAGHDVACLIRQGREQLKRRLEAAEVEPVEGNAHDVSTYQAAIDSADVVIDCLSPVPGEAVKILDAVAKVAKETKKTRRYIFTNGVMTYGDHGGEMIDETTPANPAGVLIWKAHYTKSVLARNNPDEYLETVDVRPGWLYGEDFGNFTALFAIGPNDPIKVLGSKDKKWPWVHASDCASAYVAIVEAPGSLVGGQQFNVTDDTNLTNVEMQTMFAKAAGRKEEDLTYEETTEVVSLRESALYRDFMLYSLRVSSAKIQKTLGWKPKCGPMVGNEQRLYRAWKAANELYK